MYAHIRRATRDSALPADQVHSNSEPTVQGKALKRGRGTKAIFNNILNQKFIMNFAGFSEEESYDLSLEIEPRARANSTPEKVDANDPSKGDSIKGTGSKGSRLKLSVITTLDAVRSHGPPTPPSPSTKPPQEMLSLTNRLVRKKWVWRLSQLYSSVVGLILSFFFSVSFSLYSNFVLQGKKAWLDLSDEPFYAFFQLLGTTSPLMVRLPPKCTTTQALSIFEETFRYQPLQFFNLVFIFIYYILSPINSDIYS